MIENAVRIEKKFIFLFCVFGWEMENGVIMKNNVNLPFCFGLKNKKLENEKCNLCEFTKKVLE